MQIVFLINLVIKRRKTCKSIDIQLLFLSWLDMPCYITSAIKYYILYHACISYHDIPCTNAHYPWHVLVTNITPQPTPHLFLLPYPYYHITQKKHLIVGFTPKVSGDIFIPFNRLSSWGLKSMLLTLYGNFGRFKSRL
jgi:hypothetical protein